MRKIFVSLLFILYSFVATTLSCADDIYSSLDKNTSRNTASSEASDELYRNTLNKLITSSSQEADDLDNKIKQESVFNRKEIREGRAKDYYEKGLELTQEGKFDEARAYFDKAIHITDRLEMVKNIKESQQRLKIQEAALRKVKEDLLHEQMEQKRQNDQEIENEYQQGLFLFRQKKYDQAKDVFDSVELLSANYKSTREYLRQINQSTFGQYQQEQEDLKYKLLANSRSEYKRHWEQRQELQGNNEQEAAEMLENLKKRKENKQEIEKEYQQALSLYNERKYFQARDVFASVEKLSANYQLTRSYLKALEAYVAKKEAQDPEKQELEMKRKKKQEEVSLSKEEGSRAEIVRKEREAKEQLTNQAEADYSVALKLYKDENYKEAKEKFELVEKELPGYKGTEHYLAQIKEDIEDQQRHQEQAKIIEQQRKDEEIRRQKERDKLLEQQQRQEELRREQEVAEEQERQKEAKITRSQVEEDRRQEIVRKEREAKEQLTNQAEADYAAALYLYKDNKYIEAKERFEVVEKELPGYKATEHYLAQIQEDIADQKRRQEQIKLIEQQRKKEEPSQQRQEEIKPSPELQQQKPEPQRASLPQRGYEQVPGIEKKEQLRREKEDEAFEELRKQRQEDQQKKEQEVNQQIQSEEEQVAKEPTERQKWVEKEKEKQVNEVIASVEERPKKELSKEQQVQEAQLLADLAQQSSKLYLEITELADDKDTIVAKQKLAKVDKVLNNLKQEKEQNLLQMHQDQQRAQQEVLAERSREEERQSQHEQSRIKVQEEQERVNQKKQLIKIAQKAAKLNDEILRLTNAKNYTGAKLKFAQLEKTMINLRNAKETINRQAQLDAQEIRLLKEKEERRQGDVNLRRGVDLFKAKKYKQAKVIFSALASSGDDRASSYLIKIDHLTEDNGGKEKNNTKLQPSEYLTQRLSRQKQEEVANEKQQEEQYLQTIEHLENRNSSKQARQKSQRKIELDQAIKKRQENFEMEQESIRQQLNQGVESIYQESLQLYKSANYQDEISKTLDLIESHTK